VSRAARFGLVLVVLLLAPLLLIQGLAQASVPLGPGREQNGYFRALQALSRMELRQSGQSVTMQVTDSAAKLAREAFVREPYAADALFVLAAHLRQLGEPRKMTAVIDGAYALDKRSRSIGVLQLEQAVAAGDLKRTFATVGRLSTIYPSLKQSFVQPLIGELGRDGVATIMLAELEKNPVWATDFWTSVPADPAIVEQMYRLRLATSAGTTANSDGHLLAALVASGLYDEAFAFWSSLADGQVDPHAFVAGDDLPPFGWKATIQGDRSMTSRGGGEGYDIYVQSDTSGELGRQLLRLPPGEYSFAASVVPAGEAENVSVRLQCADAEQPLGSAQPLDQAAKWSVRDGGCAAWWLILEGSAWNSRQSLRATISDMRFGPGEQS
jgi:hypothetical protein